MYLLFLKPWPNVVKYLLTHSVYHLLKPFYGKLAFDRSARALLHLVHTAKTPGQYSPVRRSHWVSKKWLLRIIFRWSQRASTIICKCCIILFCRKKAEYCFWKIILVIILRLLCSRQATFISGTQSVAFSCMQSDSSSNFSDTKSSSWWVGNFLI